MAATVGPNSTMTTPVVAPVEEAMSFLGLCAPPDIQIECPAFEGSLVALLATVRQRKIDILDVPLAPICEAYVEYLARLEEGEVDGAASALLALAYLVERKAFHLLPRPESEEELEEEEAMTIEPWAHLFGPAVDDLRDRHSERDRTFFRPWDEEDGDYALPFELGEVSSDDLARAFESLLKKARPDPVKPLSKPRRSLEEMMGVVTDALPEEWSTIDALVTEPLTRSEAVWWFLALLELIRLRKAQVRVHEGVAEFAAVTES